MRCVALITTMVALILAVRGAADDWPEFRGPTGQGIAAAGKLPIAWGTSKNIAWKQEIPGRGWSSPVVYQGRVYLTTSVPAPGGDQSLRALCLDADNGTILWDREIFHQDAATAPVIHGKNSHASPTPLIQGRRLYVHFGRQGTACLDLAGKVLWRNNELTYTPVHGNGGSPMLAGNLLLFSCDGGDQAFIAALDRATGRLRWKTERGVDAFKRFSFSTPLLIAVNGRQQIVSPASNAVYAYDPVSGEEIWRVRYDGYSVIPRPVYGQGLLFICTGYEAPSLLAIRPDGKGDVTESHVAWRTNRAVPHTPSPLLVGTELYLVSDSGVASCLDARTGRVHWTKRLGGSYSASPLYAGGKVYFQNEDGLGTVIEAGRHFQALARNDLEERALASYAAAGNALFIRTQNHLYRVQIPQ
jgi:outer membrane protein assembly factor BamB